MLAQALANYADTYLRDQLDDFAFEEKPVPFLVTIGLDGRFLGLVETTETIPADPESKKKDIKRVPGILVPRSPIARNSTVAPLLGVDSIQYVVGPGAWTTAEKAANHTERFEGFKQLHARVAADTNDPCGAAVTRFYENSAAVESARAELAKAKAKEGTLVALAIRDDSDGRIRPPEVLIVRPLLRAWWRSHFSAQTDEKSGDATEAMCLISGKHTAVAATHPPIKGTSTLGGQPSGVSLMSFDKRAFCSYGWEQNENAPVSVDRANAYVLALNDLLRRGDHRLGSSPDVLLQTRFDVNDSAFLYWTDVPVDDDPLGDVIDPAVAEERALRMAEGAQKATAVLEAPLTGGRAGRSDLIRFYLMVVSANGARLVVRRWIARSLPDVRHAVTRWFEDLAIADVFTQGQIARRPRLLSLLRTLVPDRGTKTFEQLRGGDTSVLLARALGDGRLGLHLLAAALRQQQHAAETRLAPERAGFIRLLTNDSTHLLNDKGPLMPASLDEAIDYPAYLCGRLFAELENLQREANEQELNATITDRYYAAACRNPQQALPRLLELKEAHLRKLRRNEASRGAYFAISRKIDDLVARFGGPPPEFPGALSIIDQGRFAIGYHHHRADARRQIEERRAQKAASVTP